METTDFSQPLRDPPGGRRNGGGDVRAMPRWLGVGVDEPAAFTDPADGRRWTVVEQPGGSIPGARGPSCLCFQSQDIFRRVWRFPVNWRELPDAELAALSRSW